MSDDQELQDVIEGLNEAEAKEIELNLTLKEQANKLLAMPEIMERFRQVRDRAVENRDRTFGDEHFTWSGHAICLKELFKAIETMAEYQVPKKGPKRAAQYV